jgi:hypothetical protein
VAAAARDDVDRVLLCPANGLLDIRRGLAIDDRPRMGAVEAAVDQQPVPSVRGAPRRDDRPLDLACQLPVRPTRPGKAESRKDADGARSKRDTRRLLEEFAPVDDPTLCPEAAGYELETAPRRGSAAARPQREIASAADEIPPRNHRRPIPRRYRAATSIQLQSMRRA